MLNLIHKEHEICCPNCGCVLGDLEEPVNESTTFFETDVKPNIDIMFLGSAIEKNTKKSFRRTPYDTYMENTVRNIENIVKKFGLPDRFVIEVFNEMKRRKSGFRSENEPIKILIKILSKDDNFFFNKQLRQIKARYEGIINI